MKTLLLSILFSISSAHAARFVVESHKILSASEMKQANFKVSRFAQVEDAYFSRLYVVSGNISLKEVEKLSWAKRVEQGFELSRLSLLPSDKPDMVVAEELFPYQWGLVNQGQVYNREKDDIHNLPVAGVNGKDIKWKKNILREMLYMKILRVSFNTGAL